MGIAKYVLSAVGTDGRTFEEEEVTLNHENYIEICARWIAVKVLWDERKYLLTLLINYCRSFFSFCFWREFVFGKGCTVNALQVKYDRKRLMMGTYKHNVLMV